MEAAPPEGLGDDEEDDHQGTKTPRKELLLRDLRVSVMSLNATALSARGEGKDAGLALAPA
jgi:hypothetical protein